MLSLGHNAVRAEGMAALVAALGSLPRLHSLNVTHNALGAAGLARLLEGLPGLPSLAHLCLGANDLHESALSDVLGASAWPRNPARDAGADTAHQGGSTIGSSRVFGVDEPSLSHEAWACVASLCLLRSTRAAAGNRYPSRGVR